MTTRVLLVDDDPLVLAGLRLLLGGDPGIDIVGAVGDGALVVDAVREGTPDVVLMDVRMPRTDGISALRLLRQSVDRPPAVVMLTTFDAEPVVLDALRAGAAGFLLKHAEPDQIIGAVHSAASGEATVSPLVLRRLIDRVTVGGDGAEQCEAEPGADPLAELTERERDVAFAVADGLSNQEIARALLISVGSVKTHISSALAKLGVDNRVQLAIAAHESRRSR